MRNLGPYPTALMGGIVSFGQMSPGREGQRTNQWRLELSSLQVGHLIADGNARSEPRGQACPFFWKEVAWYEPNQKISASPSMRMYSVMCMLGVKLPGLPQEQVDGGIRRELAHC